MPHPVNHSTSTPPSAGWIAVDLDGTLASYDPRHGVSVVGKPINSTILRIRQWLEMGIEVRIFTARASDPLLLPAVHQWLFDNGLPPLAVTNRRDIDLMQLWDDRAVQVETNTGVVLTPRQYISLNTVGWIGVELDGTLAHYDSKNDNAKRDFPEIGAPVEKMLARVQQWLAAGIDVRLFTARAAHATMIPAMEAWLQEKGLQKMKITCEKDFSMAQFWDDRAIHVVSNSGEIAADMKSLAPKRKYNI